MAKFDRLVIFGDQLKEIDVDAMARVVILLARRRLRRIAGEAEQATNGEAAS